ncbi:Scr1 family TA system antitoxin-like transcriptional regulator [Streptomyces sp. ARC32]
MLRGFTSRTRALSLANETLFAAGAHSALGGSLTLLSFASAADVVYLEGVHSGELVEDRAMVARHSKEPERGF